MADSGNYAARATALRETVKWVAAVFVGAGAILFSGLSFTNIEKTAASEKWLMPVLLAVIPVLAAAFAVQAAAQVISRGSPDAGWLLPRLVGRESLSEPAASLREKVEALAPATVVTFGDIGTFEARLADMQDRVRVARAVYETRKSPENRRELDAAYENLANLQEGVRDLLLCADFVQVDQSYRSARWKLLVAALIGILAAAGSGVASARLTPTEKIQPAAVTHPLDVRVYFEHGLSNVPCRVEQGQRATAIGGSLTRPLLLMPAAPANSQASAACHRPWRWEPLDAVVIVPQSDDGGAG
ncbi:hypothetical protein ACGFYQ_05185 [Streptomyces sp. NPDC048258]|uniref:hypothetical protein n=1 Tax=Streptomyces sp. NPDC048258 TaxID=3365527 RepID=UPI0037172756